MSNLQLFPMNDTNLAKCAKKILPILPDIGPG